jgi:NADPH2:quinone reductase
VVREPADRAGHGRDDAQRAPHGAGAHGRGVLAHFLQKIGPAAVQAPKQRVAAELTTTFKSHYTREISLVEALQPEVIAAYGKRAACEKFLINPAKRQVSL